MATAQEKAEFSARLHLALRKSAHLVKGATDLAYLFNSQNSANSNMMISMQTAHKWLNGRAIPHTDKIKALAKWLGVSEHWLYYGPPPAESSVQNTGKSPLPSETLLLVQKIEMLPEHKRHFVKELVRYLAE